MANSAQLAMSVMPPMGAAGPIMLDNAFVSGGQLIFIQIDPEKQTTPTMKPMLAIRASGFKPDL